MKNLFIIAGCAVALLASCTNNKTYTFRSVKSGVEFEQSNYQFAEPHKIGDTITMPMYLGEPDGFKTVDVILVSVK